MSNRLTAGLLALVLFGVACQSAPITGRKQFLNFELFGTWFPHDKRPLGRRGAGYLELDLEWFPSYEWLVEVRALYDWDEAILETGSVLGRYIPRDDLRFFGSVKRLRSGGFPARPFGGGADVRGSR